MTDSAASPRQRLLESVASSPVSVCQTTSDSPYSKSGWRAHCRKIGQARSAMLRRAHEVRLAGELLAIAQANELEVVALYAAIGVEVPTRELANLLLVHGHKLVYPRLRADGVLIDFCSTDGPAALVKRPRSRLLEPVGAPVDPREINLIVVPSLALDGQLRRLGRGGGSYDRYLPQLSDHTLRVGALAADCVVAWQPVQAHDAQLDAVCTEHGLFGSHAPQ